MNNSEKADKKKAMKVLFSAYLLSMVGNGLLVNCNGIVLPAISREMGFPIGSISLTLTFKACIGMFTTAISGRLMQKYVLKNYLAAVYLAVAVCYVCMIFCTQLWQFFVVSIFMGLVMGMAVYSGAGYIAAGWTQSPVHLSLAIAMTGIGGVVFSPILSYVVARFGWRGGYWMMAGCVALILIPSSRWMYALRSSDLGIEPLGGGTENHRDIVLQGVFDIPAEKLKHSAPYYFTIAYFTFAGLAAATYVHLPGMLLEKGADQLVAGSFNSVYMIGIVVGPIVCGSLYNRLRARSTIISVSMVGIIGAAVFQMTRQFLLVPIALGAMLLGFARNGMLTGGTLIMRDMYGSNRYTAYYPQMISVYVLVSGLSSALYGYIRQWFGTYGPVYVVIEITKALAILMACMLISSIGRLRDTLADTDEGGAEGIVDIKGVEQKNV